MELQAGVAGTSSRGCSWLSSGLQGMVLFSSVWRFGCEMALQEMVLQLKMGFGAVSENLSLLCCFNGNLN
ncbi:hypothetical protein C5167_028699 [Papaver somniferum]|nr:hypothetical protein C5167_028699 [Papaver somniferum]